MTPSTEKTSLVPEDSDAAPQQRQRRAQQHSPSTVIFRLVAAAGFACFSAILLTIARNHVARAPALSRPTHLMGVTKEKLAILQGAQTELTAAAPPYVVEESAAPKEEFHQEFMTSDALSGSDGGGGAGEYARNEVAEDVLSMAGEALGLGSSYATPFPAFTGDPRVYTYKIANKYNHDHTAFTQGLVYSAPDTLFESTGSVQGASSVREVNLLTGTVVNKKELSKEHFAEGLTMHGGGALQLECSC